MASLGLAQLVALVQGALQRSYDHIEDVAQLRRGGGESSLSLALQEVSVSLPVTCELRTGGTDVRDVLESEESPSALSLLDLLLEVPAADPALRSAVREEVYAAIASRRLGREASPDGSVKREAVQLTEPSSEQSKRRRDGASSANIPSPLVVPLTEATRESLRRAAPDGRLLGNELVITVVGEEGSGGGTAVAGRLDLRFAPVPR